MGFFAMCLLGFKIVMFLVLAFIGFGSAVAPIAFSCEEESFWPITLYIIFVPITCGCIKMIQLLL